MVLVAGPTLAADPIGLACALAAAAAWAGYLVASRKAAAYLPGLVPSAIASVTGIAVLTPIVLMAADLRALGARNLGLCLLAGLLSSAIPYALDILALRRIELHVASNLMSLHPIMAAIFGALLLGERPEPLEILGLAVMVIANVIVVRGTGPSRDTVPTTTGAMALALEETAAAWSGGTDDIGDLGQVER